jgi:protein phosphatase
MALEAVPVAVPMLVRRAVERAGPIADNATALAMSWEGDDDCAPGSAQALAAAGGIMSTISMETSGEAGPADPMSDAEIERTVREIRETIARMGGT